METEELSREYIGYAKRLVKNGSFSKAFDLYILAFDRSPQLRPAHESEFRDILTRLNEILAAAGKMEDIFHNFGRALKAFSDNKYLLNDMGKYLYKYAFYNEAWHHFKKALKRDSSFVNPEKNINSIKNLLVERWHFRMLNDKIRNEAYRNAIHETLIPLKDSVIDLGTGTGLLAMYAFERNPMAVTGCDGSEIMTALAENITRENDFKEIVIINNMSTSMNFWDIGGKRSLILTEMFDAGLFGEHILQTLSHAWANLMSKSSRVIPNKAEFFVIGAKSDHLHAKYQLCSTTKTLLNIPSLNVHVFTHDETYDCEDVHLVKDITYVTDCQSLLKINFNNSHDIEEKLNRTEPYRVELKAKENSEINTIIGWFNLYLTDQVTITTDPRSDKRANAWQQAVFFDDIPRSVKENQTVNIEFLVNGGKLTMLPNYNANITRITPEAVRFLNDTDYIKMITGCIAMACVYLGQMAEMAQICIADLCPFPLFGMIMLKRGAQSLVCCAKTESDKHFFLKVFKENQVPLTKVTMLLGDEWTQSIFGDDKYHAIFCNIYELCGDIDLRYRDIALHLKTSHLLRGGLFMPANMTTVCQLVSSDWLDINNRLYDENVSNYKMALYVNKYEVTQNFCIDFAHMEYEAISDPVDVATWDSQGRFKVVNVPIVSDGYPNGILCWYKMELMEDLDVMSTNRSNSFIDGTVFLTKTKQAMFRGQTARIACFTDADGSFKLKMEAVAT